MLFQIAQFMKLLYLQTLWNMDASVSPYGDLPHMKGFLKELKKECDEQFDGYESEEILLVATYLDPR